MLKLDIKKPRKFISPLLSKKSITTNELTQFLEATLHYFDELEKQRISNQSEPNIVSNVLQPFFKQLGYVANSYSQKGQSGIDLALMLDHSPAVIIEAKAVDSSAMISKHDINKKALHEAILYFMRERAKGNDRLYHIIITDFYRWFVFDAKDFDRFFWKNGEIKKIFESVKDPSVLGDRTEDFYKLIASKIVEMKSNLIDDQMIECAYFDLKDKRSAKAAMALYKLLSKDTLLKEFNPNDANTLNRVFYSELLYILGLEEQSSGGKKLISRAKKSLPGSLYENITQKLIQYGKPTDFESVIGLMIIWINRILFLKLLESQLIKWNDKPEYAFLNAKKIKDFDRLEMLFFDILAKKPHERGHREFDYVPYLNSSLFEVHAFENEALKISNLEDDRLMPYYSKTVLKDNHAQRKSTDVNMLYYLFEFLDAYDFSSEGSEELVAESKSLINASVLGLIFEKLNGYKEGSFYTPSFITMYMSKETIEKAIIEKFNQAKGWNCKTLNDVYDKIEDKDEANDIIDSLTVCDPAVGSGHFLVSVLNTILRIKSELRILRDENGKTLRDYEFAVENDELIVKDDDGEIFEYKRGSREKTRIQKLLFTHKQQIIENSLFGVDINPNSAHITRLRLWIELLKHSYYEESGQLITMPNIDINIKVGNSLISQHDLDVAIDKSDLKELILQYKKDVKEYKEGSFISTKNKIRKAINDAKNEFKKDFQEKWSETQKYKKLLGGYVREYGFDKLKKGMKLDALEFNYGQQMSMFIDELTKAQQKEKEKQLKELEKIGIDIEYKRSGKVYEDAFEWRFEFPEVLDEEGNFVGFDVVIGNPPYIRQEKIKEYKPYLSENYSVYEGTSDIYVYFYELGNRLLKENALNSFICSNSFFRAKYGKKLRTFILNKMSIIQIADFNGIKVFEDAAVDTAITILRKVIPSKGTVLDVVDINLIDSFEMKQKDLTTSGFTLISLEELNIKKKMEQQGTVLKEWDIEINYGIKTGFNEAFIIDGTTKDELIEKDIKSKELIKPLLRGRDIEKYHYIFADKWLINSHNNPPVNIEDYPAIKEHLDSYYNKLEKRGDKGATPYNLRNCAYLDKFKKTKIIYPDISDKLTFTFDNQGYYFNNTVYFIDTDSKYMLSILNSKIVNYYYGFITSQLGSKGIRAFTVSLMEVPIPKIDKKAQQPFITLADQIITLKKQNQDTSELEVQIDQMVYELYGLSEDEVALVEGEK